MESTSCAGRCINPNRKWTWSNYSPFELQSSDAATAGERQRRKNPRSWKFGSLLRARCDINLFVCEPNWSTIPFASWLPSAFTSESSRHTRFEMLQPMHSDVAWQQQPGWTVVNFSFFSTGVSLVPPNWSIYHFARLEPPHAAAEPHWAFSTRPLWLLRVLPLDNDSRGPSFEPSNRSYAWQNR